MRACLTGLTSSDIRFCDTVLSQLDDLYEFLLFPHCYMVAPELLGQFLARLLLADTTWRDVLKPGQTWWYDATCMHVKSKWKGCCNPTALLFGPSGLPSRLLLAAEGVVFRENSTAPHKTLDRHNQQLSGEQSGTLNSKRAWYITFFKWLQI